MRGLVLALGGCVLLNAALRRLGPPAPREGLDLPLETSTAVETAGLVGLGMRRLAADLAFVRFLVYYGTPEEGSDLPENPEFYDREHPERHYGGGTYAELGPRARRILDLDPSFSYVPIYASGALAYNLNRPDEALALLEYASTRDPRNLQYGVYIAAIGFHRHGDPESVIRLLEPLLGAPDCPTLIKSMVAFLEKRAGRREQAARLYRDILENSRDAGYRSTAERMLRELEASR